MVDHLPATRGDPVPAKLPGHTEFVEMMDPEDAVVTLRDAGDRLVQAVVHGEDSTPRV
jgi:hypothetical protein